MAKANNSNIDGSVLPCSTPSTSSPDNVVTMDVNGTKMVIKEFFIGKETVNDIIARRIKRDLDSSIPSGENV